MNFCLLRPHIIFEAQIFIPKILLYAANHDCPYGKIKDYMIWILATSSLLPSNGDEICG